MKKGVILVSGGADSATLLAIAKSQGFELYAMSFSYNQRHSYELQMAKALTKDIVTDHIFVNIDPQIFAGSSLTDKTLSIEHFTELPDKLNSAPSTYVPARNTLFLSYGLSYAESIGAAAIFIGIHAQDAPYPDCRPEFRQQFQQLINVATSTQPSIQLHTPLLELSKAQIIATGLKLGVDYSRTISCYNPNTNHASCAKCLACVTRLDAFAKNQVVDPVKYLSHGPNSLC
jgi:7-cyano-7-deazaguanine synthase